MSKGLLARLAHNRRAALLPKLLFGHAMHAKFPFRRGESDAQCDSGPDA
jgi:hypothetical protein